MIKIVKNLFSFNLFIALCYLPLFYIIEVFCKEWTPLGIEIASGAFIVLYYLPLLIAGLIFGLNEFLILYILKLMNVNFKFSLDKFTNNKFYNIFLLGALISFLIVLFFVFWK